MPTPAELRTARTAEFYILRVRLQYEEFLSRTYPSGQSGTQKVLGLISGLLETAEKKLLSRSGKSLPRENIRDAIDHTRAAYELLSLMSGSDITELDFPAVRPMQRWFTQLLGKERTIFFRAENLINYEIRPEEKRKYDGIRNPSPSLKTSIQKIKWPLTRVTVPSRALSILPHFSIVAHEAGHAIYNDFITQIRRDLDSKKTVLKPIYGTFKTAFKKRVPRNYLNAKMYDLRDTILGLWTEEVAADAIAFALTGPASFFALSDILHFMSNSPRYYHTHPPKTLRRKFLFDLLSYGDYSYVDVLKTVKVDDLSVDFNSAIMPQLPNSDRVFDDYIRQNYRTEYAAALAELPPVMEAIGPIICLSVLNKFKSSMKLKKLLYTPEKLEEDLREYYDNLLKFGIPPIETNSKLGQRKEADFASILNVGWIALLCGIDKFVVNIGQERLINGAKAETLHRLLLKATELSEVRKQWNEA